MTNNFDYIYYFYLNNTPIGTHRATLTDVESYCDESGNKQYIKVTFYIKSLDKNFTYSFRKSNSFLSKYTEFSNMLKRTTNLSFFSISELMGESFDITIAVSPHYDEKDLSYLKITDIKHVKEVN